jgi:hypothetical protein
MEWEDIEDEMKKKGFEKDQIIKILTDYRNGKLDKYEAMDALDLTEVRDLLALLSQYEIPPEDSPAYWQSDPSAKPLKDFFTDDG